jgi:hypothetical protein
MIFGDMSGYAYFGVLGEVEQKGGKFAAWKDGFWIGTYDTLEEAMDCLTFRERLKIESERNGIGKSA